MAQQSEVARLRELIEAEYAAARSALNGTAAGMAQHRIINAKLDRMSTLSIELAGQLGKDDAMKMIIEILEEKGGK